MMFSPFPFFYFSLQGIAGLKPVFFLLSEIWNVPLGITSFPTWFKMNL
jgi:hypothetical protein